MKLLTNWKITIEHKTNFKKFFKIFIQGFIFFYDKTLIKDFSKPFSKFVLFIN